MVAVTSAVGRATLCRMTLDEHELRALEQLRHILELDDPKLARQLRDMRRGPTTSALAVFVLLATLVGFALVGVGRDLDLTAITAFGLAFALCVPILGGMWFSRLS